MLPYRQFPASPVPLRPFSDYETIAPGCLTLQRPSARGPRSPSSGWTEREACQDVSRPAKHFSSAAHACCGTSTKPSRILVQSPRCPTAWHNGWAARYGQPVGAFAIEAGACELRHTGSSTRKDARRRVTDEATPIGADLPVCERDNCPQRLPRLRAEVDEHHLWCPPYLIETTMTSQNSPSRASPRRSSAFRTRCTRCGPRMHTLFTASTWTFAIYATDYCTGGCPASIPRVGDAAHLRCSTNFSIICNAPSA